VSDEECTEYALLECTFRHYACHREDV